MTQILSSRVSAVVLSRGGTWSPQPWEPPYTLPDAGSVWPAGTVSCVFYDTSGGILATVAGTVAPTGITFTAAPAVVDLIPMGAKFEIFLTTGGAPYQIRCGTVIRREAQFTTADPSTSQVVALYTDIWPIVGLRASWITSGSPLPIVHDNSGVSLTNGVSLLSGGGDGQMRWAQPLNGDTCTVKISALNRYSYANSTFSKMRIILCANQALTAYLAVELHASTDGAGAHTDQIHFGIGTSPTAVTYQGSTIVQAVANNDTYTIIYDNPSATIFLYRNGSTTPIGSWTDASHVVPHGPGHRYLGFSWSINTTGDGHEVTSWSAQDGF